MSVVTGDNNNNNDDGDGGPRRSSCRRYCHAGDDDVWVDAVAGLRTRGVATVRLPIMSPASEAGVHGVAFREARLALDHVVLSTTHDSSSPVLLSEGADSAHATGFHVMGGMSRYNAMREGIVFSDGNIARVNDDENEYEHENDEYDGENDTDGVDVNLDNAGDKSDDGTVGAANNNNNRARGTQQQQRQQRRRRKQKLRFFEEAMYDMGESLHGIADRVLAAVEEELHLPPGWFEYHLGPFRTSSQWHMKRFAHQQATTITTVATAAAAAAAAAGTTTEVTETTTTGSAVAMILLPMHTDPSLISVVIHDAPGVHGAGRGAMGLQHYDASTKRWVELEGHGHDVATVLVGSVLAHLTGGRWPASKHRVVEVAAVSVGSDNGPTQGEKEVTDVPSRRRRMAATLFVRPRPDAVLRVIPLPTHSSVTTDGAGGGSCAGAAGAADARKKPNNKADVTFETWLKRVAKNYERKKPK